MRDWKKRLNPDAAKAEKKAAPQKLAIWTGKTEDKFRGSLKFSGAPAQEELMPLESSEKLGMSSKRLSTAPDLTSLINFGDYFGGAGRATQAIDEESASMEGNASDYDDDPNDDAYLKLIQQQEAPATIDSAPRNDQESFFKPWEDLSNEALPGDGMVGEGSSSQASRRAAAAGGLNPNWHSTDTRNARDAKLLPYAQGGDESTTRERALPTSIGQGFARRELGIARHRFNAEATPDNRLVGPRHDGTQAEAEKPGLMPYGDSGNLVDVAKIKGTLKGYRKANRRSNVRANLGAWERADKPEQTAQMDVIDEVDSGLEEDRLTEAMRPDHFYNADDLRSAGEGLLDGGNEGMERHLASRAEAANHQSRSRGGIFSRMGRSLSKAASVMGGAFSSMGRGIKSWFGSGARTTSASAPDTSTPRERVLEHLNDEAAAENAGQYFPEVADSSIRQGHVPEPDEVVAAEKKADEARRRAAIPKPESYTEEQVQNEGLDGWNSRLDRYQSEAHQYAGGEGVPRAGGMLGEDRQRLAGEFFSKFRNNPRLSFGPYAQNRQEDVWDAEESGKENPLYPERAIGQDATAVGFTQDEVTGKATNFDVNDTYFMDDEQKSAHAQAARDKQDNLAQVNAMIRKYERPAKERALKEQQRREAEERQRQRERDDQSFDNDLERNKSAMENGAEQTTALHPGMIPVHYGAGRSQLDMNENHFAGPAAGELSESQESNASSDSVAALTSEIVMQDDYFAKPSSSEISEVPEMPAASAKLKPAKKAAAPAKKAAKKAAVPTKSAQAPKVINIDPKAVLKEVPSATSSAQKRAQISTSTADMRRMLEPQKPGLLDRIGNGVENAAEGIMDGLSGAMDKADAMLASPEENAKAQKERATLAKEESARVKADDKVRANAQKTAQAQQAKAIAENEAKRMKAARRYNS